MLRLVATLTTATTTVGMKTLAVIVQIAFSVPTTYNYSYTNLTSICPQEKGEVMVW